MPNVGTISGSMYLDPSAYIAGLNQAAQSTQMFQAGVERVSFAGFHRGIFATTTLLYGLNRIISSMSQGMEEYTNMLGRIGSVADMTAASVETLADSMKKLSVAQGVSRTDIMSGMYTAAQSGFSSPAEMRKMATSGALLSRASGKEIDVRKSVDLMSVARQALGIGQGAISSNRMTDLLLKGRDVGRWELDEMAHALGIPLTVYGNQFAKKIGGEETLRQLVAILSTATLAGVNPTMAATGTRRIVERSIQLQNTKRGDPLRQALRGIGFTSGDPIEEAMSSPMNYLNTIVRLTGGRTSELGKLGFGSRDLMVTTAALRDNANTLNSLHSQLGYPNIAGTTQKYNEKMSQTYDAKRDQLRAQWTITSQEFMQASIPMIEQFTNALMSFNQIAQNLPASVKSFMMLVSGLAAMRLTLNFLGFRSQHIPFGAAVGKGGGAVKSSASGLLSRGLAATYGRPENAAELRQARRAAFAASRPSPASFGSPSGKWVPNVGTPWGTNFSAFKPMMWNEIPLLDRSSGGGFGPAWYSVPRGDPMNYYQYQNMLATSKKWDRARAANNAKFWAPNGNPWIRPAGGQSTLTLDRETRLAQMGALARRYGVLDPALGTPLSGRYLAPGSRTTQWGPTAEARIHWAAYKQGQSVNFDDGSYSSMSPRAKAYSQRQPQQGSRSVREYSRALASLGASMPGMTSPFVSNIGRTMVNGDNGQIGLAQQVGRYYGANKIFGENGVGAKAAMYSSMGIGGGAQAVGWAVSGLSRFGSAIWSVVGPMAQFGAILTAMMKMFEGWSYSGSSGAMLNGKSQLASGGKMPALLTSIGHGYKMFGSWLHHGNGYLGDMTADYAREEGYVPGFEGLDDTKPNSKWDITKALAKTVFGSTFLGGAIGAIRGRPMGLSGFRPGTTKDAGADLRRELLTPGEVRQFSKKGGINFDDFSTIKPYLNRYMTEQIGQTPPDDWDAWIAKTKGGYGKVQQWGANAIRFYRGDILGNIQRTFDKDNRIWRASAPDDIKQGLVEARALRDSQWDLYKSADYSTPKGNGSLNWGAGGRDYRKLYNAELDRMDASYANFATPSPYSEAKTRIDGLEAMWKKRAGANGATFAGLGIDENLQFALKDAKGESEQQKTMRDFMRVMPEIGSMDVESSKNWFRKLTGRDADANTLNKTNFDNFRNMDLRNFISPESLGHDVRYESATQFGTAEAYNQLLPKQNAEEKIVVAMDKFGQYIETLKADKGETETAMSEVMKRSLLFLKAAENTSFFSNIQNIAVNTGDL